MFDYTNGFCYFADIKKDIMNRFFVKILLIINILAIVGLLLSYASAHVSPVKVPFLALFSLAYPHIVLLNIGFFILWIIFRKWYFIISLAILTLGIKTLSTNFKFIPAKHTCDVDNNKKFKVLSYNVQVFGLYANSNKHIQNNIFKFIRTQNPDIACFQEYYEEKNAKSPMRDSLIKNQKFKYSHIYYTYQSKYQKFGIATYSRYPIINKQVLKFNNTFNVSIFSDIKINKDTLRFFNCHLESIGFSPDDYNFIDSIAKPHSDLKMKTAKNIYARLKEAYKKRSVQINLLIEQVKKSPYPVVLCGDFNDPPSSYTYKLMSDYLTDSFVKQGIGKGATFSRNIFSYRIDYIFYSPCIDCYKFNIPKNNYSDHYPIIGNYCFK